MLTAKLTAIGVDNRGRWRTNDVSECQSSLTRWTAVDIGEHVGANHVCATGVLSIMAWRV